MTGLTNENMSSMISTLEQNFRVGATGDAGNGTDTDPNTPIKVENSDFVDAEKWNAYEEPHSDYFFGYDTLHCWAASCANMLRLSGWAKGLINPRTNELFRNEDDIFEYYNVNFYDNGSNADRHLR